MIKYDIAKQQWINTENPFWTFDRIHNGKNCQKFPDSFEESEAPKETFETVSAFCDWISGHSLKHTSVGITTAPMKTEDGKEIPFYWQINLHPLITTDEFSWGVRIANKFEYWYHAHQYAQRIDAYIDDVLRTAKEEWEEQLGEFLQQGEDQRASLTDHPNFLGVIMIVDGLGKLEILKDFSQSLEERFIIVSVGGMCGHVSDEKGNLCYPSTNPEAKWCTFETLGSAIAFIGKIDQYWQSELPQEDIKTFLNFIKEGNEHPEDIKSYEEFVALLLNRKWKQAHKHFKYMDTFVRDAIPLRICHEIEKHINQK